MHSSFTAKINKDTIIKNAYVMFEAYILYTLVSVVGSSIV